ncbi:UNVERIFIED_CONTAM: hypothetical protein IGO34_28505, partial [Salmonella enterica subsp. enterica serovar Weltevreden]
VQADRAEDVADDAGSGDQAVAERITGLAAHADIVEQVATLVERILVAGSSERRLGADESADRQVGIEPRRAVAALVLRERIDAHQQQTRAQ